MAFERGSISFRLFQLPGKLPEDVVERFAARAAPPLEAVRDRPSLGWVTGRHLLDRNLVEDTAWFGGYLRLTLRIAERKVPASLLQAECRMEELARLAAEGRAFLNRKDRTEIRREVRERLLPEMPPQIKGIPMVARRESPLVFVGATALTQADTFASAFQEAVGSPLFPLTPDALARDWFQADPAGWPPLQLTDQAIPESPDAGVGRDFLTWLWFRVETSSGGQKGPGGIPHPAMIEGPLTLVYEGHGAHETSLRKGEPVGSVEARTALQAGKKLSRARVTLLGPGGEPYAFLLDADQGVIRNLALPPIEELLDPVSLFEERMRRLETFAEALIETFGAFVRDRRDAESWARTAEEMRRWVASRTGRK